MPAVVVAAAQVNSYKMKYLKIVKVLACCD